MRRTRSFGILQMDHVIAAKRPDLIIIKKKKTEKKKNRTAI